MVQQSGTGQYHGWSGSRLRPVKIGNSDRGITEDSVSKAPSLEFASGATRTQNSPGEQPVHGAAYEHQGDNWKESHAAPIARYLGWRIARPGNR